MASVNAVAICEEWYNRLDHSDGQRRGGQRRINLENLKLKAYDIKWTNTSPVAEFQGPTRRVNVHNETGHADVFGNLTTSRDSKLTTKITLTQGRVEGLNKKMRLPLPEAVKSSLGQTLDIDPSKHVSEPQDTMSISLTSGHDIPAGAGSATATVSCKEEEYQGRFECRVGMKGKVIFQEGSNSALEYDIASIVKELPNKRGLTVHRDEVSWEMAGFCELRWDFEQTVVWN